MTFKIGFESEQKKKEPAESIFTAPQKKAEPRKSLVQIYFEARNMTLAYYNDMFDLHCGDIVYVDGRLEGLIGRVTQVNYNFKINISDYKKVIALADTDIQGKFFIAGSSLITFQREALPVSKVSLWFNAPAGSDTEFEIGYDDTSFPLNSLKDMDISPVVAERGSQYYIENKIKYISIDGTKGYAVVSGSKNYEIEFEYNNGEISRLVCSCFCSYNCKHEFAAMLQLQETLNFIEKNFEDEYKNTGYFAAINKSALFSFAVAGKDKGSVTFE